MALKSSKQLITGKINVWRILWMKHFFPSRVLPGDHVHLCSMTPCLILVKVDCFSIFFFFVFLLLNILIVSSNLQIWLFYYHLIALNKHFSKYTTINSEPFLWGCSSILGCWACLLSQLTTSLNSEINDSLLATRNGCV